MLLKNFKNLSGKIFFDTIEKQIDIKMNGLEKDLKALLGEEKVKTDPVDLYAYSSDAIRYFISHNPSAVVLPGDKEDVSKVLSYAYQQSIPITARGAGSGLAGGCVPIKGGIVLDMKRMNKIIEINRSNLTASAESGVVLARFHQAVEKQGLFYPPDPQSLEVCTLGGNVATRAGGPRGVKYGTTSNYVLGLEVVLSDGEVIQTGSICVKQSVGYDLTHLFTGSEGTLGVITKINLRLLPLPKARLTGLIICESLEFGAKLISELIARGIVPAKLEFLHKGAIGLMNSCLANKIPLTGMAYLLFELDGGKKQVEEEAENLKTVCQDLGALELRMVLDQKEAEGYWQARANLNPILGAIFKRMINEDVTVPRDKIPEMFKAVEEISKNLGITIGMGGHGGDGNIHPVILMAQINPELEKKADKAVEEIIKAGLNLAGTISGEHGIGLHKAKFLSWELGERQVALFKEIKKVFDPKGIMNPGKIWRWEE